VSSKPPALRPPSSEYPRPRPLPQSAPPPRELSGDNVFAPQQLRYATPRTSAAATRITTTAPTRPPLPARFCTAAGVLGAASVPRVGADVGAANGVGRGVGRGRGYHSGQPVGRIVGRGDGATVGRGVGLRHQGRAVGVAVAAAIGQIVGAAAGIRVGGSGSSAGGLDGGSVGGLDGVIVGPDGVGAAVRCAVGGREGVIVGPDGAVDGGAVGVHVGRAVTVGGGVGPDGAVDGGVVGVHVGRAVAVGGGVGPDGAADGGAAGAAVGGRASGAVMVMFVKWSWPRYTKAPSRMSASHSTVPSPAAAAAKWYATPAQIAVDTCAAPDAFKVPLALASAHSGGASAAMFRLQATVSLPSPPGDSTAKTRV